MGRGVLTAPRRSADVQNVPVLAISDGALAIARPVSSAGGILPTSGHLQVAGAGAGFFPESFAALMRTTKFVVWAGFCPFSHERT